MHRNDNPIKKYIGLFIISFLVFYFEVLLIRWIAAEIRIFAYFKNFILIASYFGLGLGCANKNKYPGLKAASWIFLILSCLIIFSRHLHITRLFFPDPMLYQWKGSILSPNLSRFLNQQPLFNLLVGKIPNISVLLLSAITCLGITYLAFYLVVMFFLLFGERIGQVDHNRYSAYCLFNKYFWKSCRNYYF